MNVRCDYCGRAAELVDGKVIHGRKNGGKYYLCRPCMAYVGCREGTDEPVGRLANAELRNAKKALHTAFDRLWKHGRFRGYKGVAGDWLAQKMGLPPGGARISMFDVEQCRRAIRIIENCGGAR